jgi:hypothetical protein
MTGKELYGQVGAKEPILFNGKLGWIRVFCKQCNIDYDIREVDNETTHPTAAHVARFDCPKTTVKQEDCGTATTMNS